MTPTLEFTRKGKCQLSWKGWCYEILVHHMITGHVPTQHTLLGQPCVRWCRQHCLRTSFHSCVHRRKVDRSWRTPGCGSLHSDSEVYLTTYCGFLLVLSALISDCQVSQRWNNQLTAQRSSESQNHTEREVQSSTVLKNVGEKYKKKYWGKNSKWL